MQRDVRLSHRHHIDSMSRTVAGGVQCNAIRAHRTRTNLLCVMLCVCATAERASILDVAARPVRLASASLVAGHSRSRPVNASPVEWALAWRRGGTVLKNKKAKHASART